MGYNVYMESKRVRGWWNQPSQSFEIGLVLLALGLRLIYLLEVRDNPLFENPTLDAAYHLNWAKSIATGALWGTEAFFRAPFYPYLLAAFYKLTGGNLFAIRLLQHLIGIVSIWGIYRLTRLVFSESAAKLAALAAALYMPMIYFEDELLLDFLLISWMLLAFFVAHRARSTRSGKWVFVLGLVLGLFAITRPNILICVPVFGWWVWRWCLPKGTLRQRSLGLLLLLAGTLAPILPVTMHNLLVGKDLVLIASQGGINFYIGNNAESDGLSAAMPKPWGHTWRLGELELYAAGKMGHKLKPSELSTFWLDEALKWWRAEPWSALKLTFKKAMLLFSNTEISNNQNIRFFWRSYAPLAGLLPLSFGILAPFGLIGLLSGARRTPLVRLMTWVSVLYAISVVAFFVPARFRLPLLPAMFVGFGGALDLLYRRVAERSWAPAGAVAAAVSLLAVLSFGSWYRTQPPSDAQAIFQLGNAALRQNKLDEALDYYRQSLALQPGYPEAHVNMGVVFLRKQQMEPAAGEFLAELNANPRSAKACANLCTVRELQGRLAEAEEYGKRALNLEPNNVSALISLSKVWWAKRKYREAVELLESAPPMIKDSPVGRDALGGLYVQLGQFEEAERTLRPLADGQVRLDRSQIDAAASADELGYSRMVQHKSNAGYNLGWMYARKKELDQAVHYFQQAIFFRPDFSEAHANLGAAYIDLKRPDTALVCFQTSARIDSTNAGYVFNIGIARLHLGDTAAAVGEFRRALQMDPQFDAAQQKLLQLHAGR